MDLPQYRHFQGYSRAMEMAVRRTCLELTTEARTQSPAAAWFDRRSREARANRPPTPGSTAVE